jgi:hypothetical protein
MSFFINSSLHTGHLPMYSEDSTILDQAENRVK